MIFPFRDDNPVHETPYLTYGIIGLCVLVFIYQAGLPEQALHDFITQHGFVPGRFFTTPGDESFTLLSSMFMHGDIMHLAGNMLYLWIFADNVEVAMGRARFILFYLLCGLAAALSHGALIPDSTIPMVGASGAISGVLGAYLLLYPKANVRVFVALYFYWQAINVPAWVVLGLWFLMQFIGAAGSPADGPGVAFWAHIGGFVAGMALVRFFLRKNEHLFHGRHSRPWQSARYKKGPWG